MALKETYVDVLENRVMQIIQYLIQLSLVL
jgi:hypothetical protein